VAGVGLGVNVADQQECCQKSEKRAQTGYSIAPNDSHGGIMEANRWDWHPSLRATCYVLRATVLCLPF
jgi:hypothetical protein